MGATERTRMVRRRSQGQAMTEFALVFPIAVLIIFGVLTLGLWVFYQQQLTNVAREAARWAAIHSSTAFCPTTSWRDPQAPPTSYSIKPFNCDGPDNTSGNARCPGTYPWPCMTDHARSLVWGLNPASVQVNACWSGYVLPGTSISAPPDYSAASGFPQADHPPIENGVANQFVQCTISRTDPTTQAGSLGCTSRMTTAADDPASDIPGNQVTVYACFQWAPPMAGFLLIPQSVTMRAVVSEAIERQQ